jgi:hypothetical protein
MRLWHRRKWPPVKGYKNDIFWRRAYPSRPIAESLLQRAIPIDSDDF